MSEPAVSSHGHGLWESSLIHLEIEGAIATITMDDGKRNVISPRMIRDLNRALDLAEKEQSIVVLAGRDDVFSAGFDLNILKTGVVDALTMLTGGFRLAARLLAFPTPVIIACNGHALAMGAFLLLAGDYRIGSAGPFKIATNEVAIGLAMPSAGVEICRQRLTPAHFVRATLLAEVYSPESAIGAGFLDRVVPPEDLLRESGQLAVQLNELDLKAHYRSKLRARRQLLKNLKRAIFWDRLNFITLGIKRILGI